jgi:S-adenosylmethionine:tRNA ribosyltransferase-isomerase
MNLDQFDYELPDALIAQVPLKKRTSSRLLHCKAHTQTFNDLTFTDLPKLIKQGDLLVLNNTEVIPARIFGKKASGGKVEFLLERIIDEHTVLAQLRASKSPKTGTEISFNNDVVANIKGRQDDFYVLEFEQGTFIKQFLLNHGQTPLPPYIQHAPQQIDRERYQTVYAKHMGAVAAPTAGLHFDETLLRTIQAKGVELAYITLHVGAGTFQSVREEKISEHKIHSERLIISEKVCRQIKACVNRNGRVIAVGTTSVRALESAALHGELQAYDGDTNLFIYPGFKFKIVDALITNFHLPKSTLLMLVSAFAGYETTMSAYRHAIEQGYRFYSYGDAMFIEKGN